LLTQKIRNIILKGAESDYRSINDNFGLIIMQNSHSLTHKQKTRIS
jgi:hypothetical protein